MRNIIVGTIEQLLFAWHYSFPCVTDNIIVLHIYPYFIHERTNVQRS